MVLKSQSVICLGDMVNNRQGVFFAHLMEKAEGKTKDNKPFFKLVFGDTEREVKSTVWENSPFFAECRDNWQVGTLYKIEAAYKTTDYGPRIFIEKIREARESDFGEGFSKTLVQPASETDPAFLFDDAMALVRSRIQKKSALQTLVVRIFKEYRNRILEFPASSSHHAYPGGFMEHTLSTARIAVFLADHYVSVYRSMRDLLSVDLVVTGALLRGIGKLEAVAGGAISSSATLRGGLLGYAVLGRDIVHRFASETGVDKEIQLRLEHILMVPPANMVPPADSGFGTPGGYGANAGGRDYGRAFLPGGVSLEAMIVREAEASDIMFRISSDLVARDRGTRAMTEKPGPLGLPILKPRGFQGTQDSHGNLGGQGIQSGQTGQNWIPPRGADGDPSSE